MCFSSFWIRGFVFSIAILVVSCTSGNVTTPDPSQLVVPPALGSLFTYERIFVDTVSGVRVDSTLDTVVYEVSQVGAKYLDKTNVTVFTYRFAKDSVKHYVAYESDGGVSYVLQNNIRGKEVWYRIPITGANYANGIVSDRARMQIGPSEWSDEDLTVSINTVRTDVGYETVQSKTFNVVKLNQTRTSTSLRNGSQYGSSSQVGTRWFAPNLGMEVRWEASGYSKFSGQPTFSYSISLRLISYTLK